MHKVIDVTALENYRLLVEFDSGETMVYDVLPLLSKPVFSFLSDMGVFRSAYIEYGAVTWRDKDGNEIDICPDKMYMDSTAPV